jgi:exodeoxyribonuclease V alpha subunit
MEPERLYPLLDAWMGHGWIRPLDLAFTRFLHRQQPDTGGLVLLAAALVSHQLGRGHVCLDLAGTLAEPETILLLPPEGETGGPQPARPGELLAGVSRDRWEERLRESALVACNGDSDNAPLVLADGRLYLRRFWEYSRQVAAHLNRRLMQTKPMPEGLSQRLDALFAGLRSREETDRQAIHWQSVAAAIAARGAFSVISGGPGTGKTTTVVRLLGLLQELALEQGARLRMRLAAPTGKAAARLSESIGQAAGSLPEAVRGHIPTEAATLHRLLGSRPDTRHFVHHLRNPLHLDLLVVDEASMIDLEMMAALLEALPPTAQLVLLGDKDQLASVEAGAVLGELCADAETPGYWPDTVEWVRRATGYDLQPLAGAGSRLNQQIVVLRKSHRFAGGSGIGILAREVNAGDLDRVRAVWEQGFEDIRRSPAIHTADREFARLLLDGGPGGGSASAAPENAPAGYRTYLEIAARAPSTREGEQDWFRRVLEAFGRFRILAALRRGDWGVEGLNQAAARHLARAGLIAAEQGWYAGRPVMVTRNDYSLGLMNGDIGIVLPVGDGAMADGSKTLKVVFPTPDRGFKKVRPSRLNDAETAYAMTVHKSQGSEFDHTVLVLPEASSPVLTRELIYTGITRARRYFTLLCPAEKLLNEAVGRSAHRASGLRPLLNR